MKRSRTVHTQFRIGKELATVNLWIGRAELRLTMPIFWWLSMDSRYAFRRTAIAFSAIANSDQRVLAQIRKVLDNTEQHVLEIIKEHMAAGQDLRQCHE